MSDPTPSLRSRLEWFRKAAKKTLRDLRAATPAASIALADAQLAVARRHGFASWRRLRASLSASPAAIAPADADLVKQFSDALSRDRGDLVAIRALLETHPALANCRPWLPAWPHTAIEAAAHLCVWHRPKAREIAALLLERGAVCDLPTLARAGLLDEVKRRLDADPSLLEAPDAAGRTPLYRACCTYGFFKESIAVATELLRRGATVDLFSAASWMMTDRLPALLAADPTAATRRDAEGLTALHWSARTDPNDPRHLQTAHLLLDAGADAGAPAFGSEGMTPLHCAAEWPASVELAGLLIDRGAEINARAAKSLWTPLDYALDRNRTEMRDFLKSRGARTRAELDATDDLAAAAFLKVVQTGDTPAVAASLDADPSLVNRVARHPLWGGRVQALHVVIERGDRATFDLLLSRGASPDGDNAMYDHWSPLMLAVHWKRTDMIEILRARLPHLSLIDALFLGDDDLALRILASGPIMLQRPMPNDATMLHFARTPAAAERLLDLNVPLDARDKYKDTALDAAAKRGDRAVAELLLRHGAPASARTFILLGDLHRFRRSAPTPAGPDLLKTAIEAGHTEIVRWILSAGQDVNQPDTNGATPLHIAAWHGALDIARLLVESGASLTTLDPEHHATPADWARFAAKTLSRPGCLEVARYLDPPAP